MGLLTNFETEKPILIFNVNDTSLVGLPVRNDTLFL